MPIAVEPAHLQRDDLRVDGRVGRADRLGVELHELAQPAALHRGCSGSALPSCTDAHGLRQRRHAVLQVRAHEAARSAPGRSEMGALAAVEEGVHLLRARRRSPRRSCGRRGRCPRSAAPPSRGSRRAEDLLARARPRARRMRHPVRQPVLRAAAATGTASSAHPARGRRRGTGWWRAPARAWSGRSGRTASARRAGTSRTAVRSSPRARATTRPAKSVRPTEPRKITSPTNSATWPESGIGDLEHQPGRRVTRRGMGLDVEPGELENALRHPGASRRLHTTRAGRTRGPPACSRLSEHMDASPRTDVDWASVAPSARRSDGTDVIVVRVRDEDRPAAQCRPRQALPRIRSGSAPGSITNASPAPERLTM